MTENKLKKFTVIGIYADNNQRWAQCFDAEDTDHAEEQAQDSAASEDHELIIAGVVAGSVRMLA